MTNLLALATINDDSLPAYLEKLALPRVALDCKEYAFLFVYGEKNGLSLHAIQQRFSPLQINFSSSAFLRRSRAANLSNELLARAIGIKKFNTPPTVMDMTAGLAQDAAILAHLGCQLILIERSPIIAALLQEALLRAPTTLKNNMTLCQEDGLILLQQAVRADVIYIDPMYPTQNKKAAVSKEMQILRALVGDDLDAHLLCERACQQSVTRVVVKRSRLAPSLKPNPDIVYKGKAVRFDVYLPIHHNALK